MSEQQGPTPEVNKSKVAEQQMSQLREIIGGRVDTTPLDDQAAARKADYFGLSPDDYVVFPDTTPGVIREFVRFVPKEGDAEPLDGMVYVSVGGPTDNPNRSMHHVLFAPNGDISVRVISENNEGPHIDEYTVPASGSAEDIARYARKAASIHQHALDMTQEKPSETQDEAARAHQRGRGVLGRLMRRR